MDARHRLQRGGPWIASCVFHAALFVGAVLWRVSTPPRVAEPPSVEIDLVAPPPPPAPPPVAVRAPVAPPPAPTAVTATRQHEAPTALAHRALVPVPQVGPEPAVVEPVNPQPEPEPSGGMVIGPTAATPHAPAPLTAAELYGNVDAMAAGAAAAGGVDLGRPGSGYHASRDLFGRPVTGSRMDRIRAAAAGPTLAALAESNHMQAAGTSDHDARVARRAEEEFDPVRTIANLGSAVLHAPMVGVPPMPHTMTAGESAIGDSLDAAHGSSFSMMQMGTVPPPPSHTMRAEVEVDQDATGAILATRVVHPSGLAAFDRQALYSIRAALTDAAPLNDGGRRSRWAYEVSESTGPVGMILGGGNEGWRVLQEASDGIHLRFRIRRVASRPLRGS